MYQLYMWTWIIFANVVWQIFCRDDGRPFQISLSGAPSHNAMACTAAPPRQHLILSSPTKGGKQKRVNISVLQFLNWCIHQYLQYFEMFKHAFIILSWFINGKVHGLCFLWIMWISLSQLENTDKSSAIATPGRGNFREMMHFSFSL